MIKQKLLDGLFRWTKFAAARVPLAKPNDEYTITLDLPGYLQLNSYCCAVTAGYSVLRYLGIEEDFGRFYQRIKPEPDHGTSWATLERALKKAGVNCHLERQLDHDEIRAQIDKGYPMIVAIKNPGQKNGHFVVIYGYGICPQRVFLAVNDLPFCQEYRYTEFLVRLKPARALVCTGRRPGELTRLVPKKMGVK